MNTGVGAERRKTETALELPKKHEYQSTVPCECALHPLRWFRLETATVMAHILMSSPLASLSLVPPAPHACPYRPP